MITTNQMKMKSYISRLQKRNGSQRYALIQNKRERISLEKIKRTISKQERLLQFMRRRLSMILVNSKTKLTQN
jgi:hypothetical protein